MRNIRRDPQLELLARCDERAGECGLTGIARCHAAYFLVDGHALIVHRRPEGGAVFKNFPHPKKPTKGLSVKPVTLRQFMERGLGAQQAVDQAARDAPGLSDAQIDTALGVACAVAPVPPTLAKWTESVNIAELRLRTVRASLCVGRGSEDALTLQASAALAEVNKLLRLHTMSCPHAVNYVLSPCLKIEGAKT